MTRSLRVPSNWPLLWADWANTTIKMPCPSCGTFGLVLTRTDEGGIRSLACTDCGLSGLPAVQAAFDRLPGALARAQAQDAQAHAEALAENMPHLKTTQKRKAA